MKNSRFTQLVVAYVWVWIIFHLGLFWVVALKSVHLGSLWWPFSGTAPKVLFTVGAAMLLMAFDHLSGEDER